MIPIYKPDLSGNEKKYVNDCLDTTWISSQGKYVEQFEQNFAEFLNVKYATTVSNGTVALHLALEALGIGSGDEVIVPTFTYVASVNTIIQCGATPVFVDIEGDSLQVSIDDVKEKITKKTKAIMAVHLYGQACDVEALSVIAKEHSLYLIEDCAEAIGTCVGEKKVGTFGDLSTFSFFGNKTITTGEGGMVVSNNRHHMDMCKRLKNQGTVVGKRYWHDIVAYNYRMTNIAAAIGVAQLERISEIIERKIEIANLYKKHLLDLPLNVHREVFGTKNTYWLTSIILDNDISEVRDSLMEYLLDNNIESRPFFFPAHTLPMYENIGGEFPLSEEYSKRGINLPSWPSLTDCQIKYICEIIKSYFL